LSDDTPTPKASGSLSIFEQTAAEAIEKLGACPVTEESVDLQREATALRALFRSWNTRTPSSEERAKAVSRLMDLHRSVAEYVAKCGRP